MFKLNKVHKRIFAYVLDFFLISTLISMLWQVNFLNPTYDKYEETRQEYLELTDNNEDFSEIANTDEYKNLVYELDKYGQSFIAIEIGVYILYFVVFQKFANGQTLGKRIMKLQVVSTDNNKKPLHLGKLLLRSLFVYSIISSTVSLIAVNILGFESYIMTLTIVSYVVYFLNLSVILLVLFRKDNKGLHDLVAKTEVIDLNEKSE